MTVNRRILIVDDEAFIVEELAEYLEDQGFSCAVAGTGTDAIERCRDEAFSHVVLDMRMKGVDGLAVLEALSPQIAAGLKIAIVSGHATPADEAAALKNGALIFLGKPCNLQRLMAFLSE
ncbi:MAG: DNA-binding NtrC family response regulator [Alphaproteobacteria bacterium]|jgi:DNA-binding NtrC family response regulator